MMKAKNNLTTLAEVASQYEKIHTVSFTEYAKVKAQNNALRQQIKKMQEENRLLKMNNVQSWEIQQAQKLVEEEIQTQQWETREAQRLVEEAIDNKQWETREAQRLVEEAIDNKPLRRSARLAMLAARSSQ